MTDHRLAGDLRHLLTSLVRAALLSDDAEAVPFRTEARRLHDAVRADLADEDPAALRLDGLWSRAVAEARGPVLDDHALRAAPRMPQSCPLTLADLVAPTLAVPDLEERIRQAASTG